MRIQRWGVILAGVFLVGLGWGGESLGEMGRVPAGGGPAFQGGAGPDPGKALAEKGSKEEAESCCGVAGNPVFRKPEYPVQCHLIPDPGPCKGLFEKYYYNWAERKCKTFFHGGCQGTVPFDTLEECRKACE